MQFFFSEGFISVREFGNRAVSEQLLIRIVVAL